MSDQQARELPPLTEAQERLCIAMRATANLSLTHDEHGAVRRVVENAMRKGIAIGHAESAAIDSTAEAQLSEMVRALDASCARLEAEIARLRASGAATRAPDDWQCVPKKPTAVMHNAAALAGLCGKPPAINEEGLITFELADASAVYRAMLAAAPQPMASPDRAADEALGEVSGVSKIPDSDSWTANVRWNGSLPSVGTKLYAAPRTMAAQPDAMRCDECINHFVCPNCGKRTNEVAAAPVAQADDEGGLVTITEEFAGMMTTICEVVEWARPDTDEAMLAKGVREMLTEGAAGGRERVMIEHKRGCPAGGGYGHGVEPCICAPAISERECFVALLDEAFAAIEQACHLGADVAIPMRRAAVIAAFDAAVGVARSES